MFSFDSQRLEVSSDYNYKLYSVKEKKQKRVDISSRMLTHEAVIDKVEKQGLKWFSRLLIRML